MAKLAPIHFKAAQLIYEVHEYHQVSALKDMNLSCLVDILPLDLDTRMTQPYWAWMRVIEEQFVR